MASKQSVYRTAKGTQIDMLKLINQNETTIAVGNMNVNARGDKLGPGGKIIKRGNEIAGTNVPNQVAVKSQPVVEAPISATTTPTKKNVADMNPEGDE